MKAETLGNLIWVASGLFLVYQLLLELSSLVRTGISSLLVCASLWLLFSITMMPTDARA